VALQLELAPCPPCSNTACCTGLWGSVSSAPSPSVCSRKDNKTAWSTAGVCERDGKAQRNIQTKATAQTHGRLAGHEKTALLLHTGHATMRALCPFFCFHEFDEPAQGNTRAHTRFLVQHQISEANKGNARFVCEPVLFLPLCVCFTRPVMLLSLQQNENAKATGGRKTPCKHGSYLVFAEGTEFVFAVVVGTLRFPPHVFKLPLRWENCQQAAFGAAPAHRRGVKECGSRLVKCTPTRGLGRLQC
jgi:hypothetical protein